MEYFYLETALSCRIKPNPGELSSMKVKFPHPLGMIYLTLNQEGAKGIQGTIELPEKLSGEFLWEGQNVALKVGENQIRIETCGKVEPV
jgi:hypothetical protein